MSLFSYLLSFFINQGKISRSEICLLTFYMYIVSYIMKEDYHIKYASINIVKEQSCFKRPDGIKRINVQVSTQPMDILKYFCSLQINNLSFLLPFLIFRNFVSFSVCQTLFFYYGIFSLIYQWKPQQLTTFGSFSTDSDLRPTLRRYPFVYKQKCTGQKHLIRKVNPFEREGKK